MTANPYTDNRSLPLHRVAQMPTQTHSPTIHSIRKVTKLGAENTYRVSLSYNGEPPVSMQFVSVAGGHGIVVVFPDGWQTHIDSMVVKHNGGTLNPAWIRSFYS